MIIRLAAEWLVSLKRLEDLVFCSHPTQKNKKTKQQNNDKQPVVFAVANCVSTV